MEPVWHFNDWDNERTFMNWSFNILGWWEFIMILGRGGV